MLEMIDEYKDYSMCQLESNVKNILVIDDEVFSIKTVKNLLKDVPDLNVIGATTKEEAFKALEEQNIDLILLDLIMPETDGFELYKLIREKYKIPVVIVTADKRLETIQKISELGIDDYLTKPVHSFVLKEIVHGITDSREYM